MKNRQQVKILAETIVLYVGRPSVSPWLIADIARRIEDLAMDEFAIAKGQETVDNTTVNVVESEP